MSIVRCEGEDAVMHGTKVRKKKCKSKASAVVEFRSGSRCYVCSRHSDGGTTIRKFKPGSTLEEAGPK